MLPTLTKHRNLGKERYKKPKTAQEILPVKELYEDGIINVLGKFSKMYRFTDINFTTSAKADKIDILKKYSSFLNSIENTMSLQVTIVSRNINVDDFKKGVFLDEKDEVLGEYNKELNEVIAGNEIDTVDNITQEFFITLTCLDGSYKEAKERFSRIETSLKTDFQSMHSKLTPINATERVKILYTFFKPSESENFRFNFDEYKDGKKDFRDIVVPTDMTFKRYGAGCFAFRQSDDTERFGRGLVLNDYPNYLSTNFVQSVCSLHKNLIFTIDVIPIPTEEALKETTTISMSVQNNINTFMKKQREAKNVAAVLPENLKTQKEAVDDRFTDLTRREQKLFIGTVTLVHTADSKEQLDRDTHDIKAMATNFDCGFNTCTLQQSECLQSTLPLGINKIENDKELTTECVASHTPFKTQEIYQPTGIWYGKNTISGNIIMADRRTLQNGNAWILAQSGGGKSFAEKVEIQQVLAKDLGDVVCIDPEGELNVVAREFHGSVVELRTGGDKCINALEMDKYYADGDDPVKLKADYVITVCSQLLGSITNKQRNALDKGIKKVYAEYKKHGYSEEYTPTLTNLVEALSKGDNISVDLAQDLTPFTAQGSLDIFGKRTNVDLNNRFTVFDIKDLGENLWSVGMLIILDNIYNKIIRNRANGRTTYIYIDEMHLMFKERFTALYLQRLWKRIRKYNGYIVGITQDIESLLHSDISRTMISNSEIIRMLNMSQPNREVVQQLLNVSDQELEMISGSERGVGLLKFGSSIVPFNNRINPNSKVYKLFDTSPTHAQQNFI